MSGGMDPCLYLRLNEKDTGLVKRLSALAAADDMHYAFGEAGAVKTLVDALCSMIRILLVCFVLLTSVICLLNLYNSIHGWIAEQKSHFAMLMSVGATRGQIRKMLLYEACYILVRSCIWAVVIPAPMFVGLRRLLTERFGHVTIAFPWWLYVAAIFITAIVIFGFMMYHYQREKNNYDSLVREIYLQ